MSQDIVVERSGPACLIRLNRPGKRNAISTAMMDAIAAAAQEADRDPEVRSVILTGDSECFSAGADLNEALAVGTEAEGRRYFGHWHRLLTALAATGKPVVAAVEGFCLTGGLELALACDLRIAGEGARFGITSSRIGTVPGAGGTQLLPRAVGISRALELLFSAEPIDTDEAFRIGLLNRRTAKGGALAEAERIAAVHAERAPLSLRLVKRAVREGIELDLDAGLELETDIVCEIYGSEDKREGISAFLEKRTPRFTGR